ncbi:MAG: hypothetical protein PHU72_01275 [Dethiosulfovibrio sp.]|nr:hypothetical protein [Dethiosulfovibrio sp.]
MLFRCLAIFCFVVRKSSAIFNPPYRATGSRRNGLSENIADIRALARWTGKGSLS